MMEMLVRWLSSTLLNRLLSIAERRMELANQRHRVDADLAAEEIRSELKARAEARKVLIAETGYFWSAGRLGRLVFVLPLGVWWSAVCLDSIFRFGWQIAEVPVLREWGGVIVASLFLVDGARAISRGYVAARKA